MMCKTMYCGSVSVESEDSGLEESYDDWDYWF